MTQIISVGMIYNSGHRKVVVVDNSFEFTVSSKY